jgi:hypothetical protein
VQGLPHVLSSAHWSVHNYIDIQSVNFEFVVIHGKIHEHKHLPRLIRSTKICGMLRFVDLDLERWSTPLSTCGIPLDFYCLKESSVAHRQPKL